MIIYRIINKINGKIYVGQTIQTLSSRISHHIWQNKTPIQKALNKYGIQCFDIDIIDTAESKLILDEKEKYWISELNCKPPNGYNLTDGGEGLKNPTEDIRRKIGEKSKGRKWSKEQKENHIKRQTGKTITEAQKQWIGNLNRGKTLSIETRKKMSLASKGVKKSEAFKLNLKRVRTGWKLSEETKDKISKKAMGNQRGIHNLPPLYWKGKSHSEETKQKISKTNTGKKRTDEAKLHISNSLAGRKLSEEHKENVRKGLLKYYEQK